MSTNLDPRSGLINHNTAFEIMWEEAVRTADPGPYGMWTQDINAQGEQRVTLAFLANYPVFQRWQGAKVHKNLRTYLQTITYEKFEATMSQPRDLVDNDKTGALGRAIQAFANEAMMDVYDSFVSESFDGNSGAGPTGFDEVSLFSASHPHAPSAAVQSNLGSGSNLNHANVVATEAAGGLFVQENGRPLRISYNICRVGPRLKRRAMELFSTDRVVIVNQKGQFDTERTSSSSDNVEAAATRSNTYSGAMQVVVDHRVTTYYTTFIDNTKGYKPMVLFKVRNPEPITQTEMTDQDRFNLDLYNYSVEADFGVAAGHWYSAYRLTGTE